MLMDLPFPISGTLKDGSPVELTLADHRLDTARALEYRGVIFNLVFSENHMARRLWDKLGFTPIGTIPGAVRQHDDRYQDAVIMFRSLDGG